MKVGIYYPFEPYVGGGEKYVYTAAEHLSRRHSVQLISPGGERIPSIASELGCDLSRVDVAPRNSISQLEKALGSTRYDLFICVSNHAVPPVSSLGRVGVLLVQFPFPAQGISRIKTQLLGPLLLQSYDLELVYSRYVAEWLRKRSPRRLHIRIVPPPVDIARYENAQREPVILSVGRFFEGQHNKRHEDLVVAFRRLVDNGLRGWELHLAGATRPEPEHQAYLERVRRAANGYPVVFHTDLSRESLAGLYSKSSLFWHATGYGADPGRWPEVMEHFGIVTVEAMSHGCIPIVIARGGQAELIEHGANGYLWETLDELQKWTLRCISAGEDAQRQLRSVAVETSKRYATPAFYSRLDALVDHLFASRLSAPSRS